MVVSLETAKRFRDMGIGIDVYPVQVGNCFYDLEDNTLHIVDEANLHEWEEHEDVGLLDPAEEIYLWAPSVTDIIKWLFTVQLSYDATERLWNCYYNCYLATNTNPADACAEIYFKVLGYEDKMD